MKHLYWLLLLLLALPAAAAAPAKKSADSAASLPPREQRLALMLRVNDYFMEHHADPTRSIPYYSRQTVYESNIWTRAVYYEGLMALYAIYPQTRFYDYACRWADHHQWGMRRDNTATRNADNYCAGQVYIDLYRLEAEPRRLTKTLSCMNMLVNTPQVDDWTWIDAVQMGMPVLVKLAAVRNDDRYREKAWQMYCWTRDSLAGGLFNPADGLWWRDKDFVPPHTTPAGRNCYWSRGNGWVAAALVRVLEELPDDDPHRAAYADDLKAMCRALKACQRADGFWNVSLHDESHFGGPETSGTALFVYAMAWGINRGLLDRADYLPVVTRAWNALETRAVHANGFLGYVQGTGKQPEDGQPVTFDSVPDFEDYGTGCFLLAGSEVYKL